MFGTAADISERRIGEVVLAILYFVHTILFIIALNIVVCVVIIIIPVDFNMYWKIISMTRQFYAVFLP